MCDRMLQDSLRCYRGARARGGDSGSGAWCGFGPGARGGTGIQARGAGCAGIRAPARGGMGFGPRVRGGVGIQARARGGNFLG